MVALWDCDSLFYKSCYKLNEPETIEKMMLTDYDEDMQLGLLAQVAANRMETMMLNILEDISNDENNINITSQELYVTHCTNSIRKQLSPEYKSNRKPDNLTKLVNVLRSMYIFENDAIYSDTLESDDLLADRAKELHGNCIIITSDKDLIQCGGFIYNFYQKPSKKDEHGNDIETFNCKGLSYTSKTDAERFLAKQMLMGDAGDKVQGIPKIGEKTAEKILGNANTKFQLIKRVIEAYKKHYGEEYSEYLQLTFRLLYLGSFELLTPTLQIDNNN